MPGHIPHAMACGLCLVLLVAAATGEAAGQPTLTIDPPLLTADHLVVTVRPANFLDEEVGRTLAAGLPVSLVYNWQLWRARAAWRDSRLESGSYLYRIFFDVLEERYDIFDATGRSVATCPELDEVRDIACRANEIEVAGRSSLRDGQSYYVEVEARLEILEEEELRDLAGWLSGERPSGVSPDLLSGLSRHAAGVLRDLVGLGGRSTRARSPVILCQED